MNVDSSPAARRSAGLVALAVATFAFAIYAGTLGHGFALDDGPEVVDNAHIRSLASIPRVFTTASWAGAGDAQVPMYRPLTTLTYSLDYAVHGLAPLGYHIINVLLNALVTVLVLFLALHLGLPLGGAAAGALLFAALPVHVEAVANVAGRKDLLVAAFSVAAVLCHSRALRRGGLAIVAAPVLVAAALLSKESGLVTLGLLAAHDLVYGREDWRRHRGRAVALFATYLALTLAFVWARHAVLDTLVFPRVPFDENPVAEAPASVRVTTALTVLGRGLGLLFAPVSLSPDYSYAAILPVVSPLDPAFLASSVVILGLGFLAFAYRHRFPLGGFAFLWYGIAVLPASNLLVPIGTIFGERLLYLPSAAFALVAGAAASALGRRSRLATGLLVSAVLVVFGVRTWTYARAWVDDLSVFTAAVAAQPESAKAQRMLGGALVEAGRPDAAVAAFQRAIAIVGRPGTPQDRMAPALVELGVAFERLGRWPEAEGVYTRVLGADPRNADATWRLGVVRWGQGDRPGAIEAWERAVSLDPGHARALNDLGVAAYLAGNLDRAEDYWVRATRALPTLASAWYRLGNLYERLGDLPRAQVAWRRFLDTAPDRFPEMREEVARKLASSRTHR
jgi:tetratricopeptide (TPR) repeat protein